MNRRKFIKNAALTAGGMLMPLPIGWFHKRELAQALGAEAPRQHLVNIALGGGWDTTWSLTAQRIADLVTNDNRIAYSCNIDEMVAGGTWRPREFSPTAVVSPSGANGALVRSNVNFSQKFGDQVLQDRFGHTWGPAWTMSFQNESDHDGVLVIKGLNADGGHGIGNTILLHGMTSSYAISYSSVVAAELYRRRKLPLNYVMIAESPSSMHTNVAMAVGPQIPTCIQSREDFKSLTSLPTGSLGTSGTDRLNRTIAGLSNLFGKDQFAKRGSKDVFEGFIGSMNDYYGLMQSNLGDSLDLQWLWMHYTYRMANALIAAGNEPDLRRWLTRGIGIADADLVSSPYVYETRASLQTLYNAQVGKNSSTTQYQDYQRAISLNRSDRKLLALCSAVAFKYAFADFLVSTDRSGVVDFKGPGDDQHTYAQMDFFYQLLAFSGLKTMIDRFKSIDIGNGKSLFDVTTIAMHSEFDRTTFLGEDANNPGTNHGETATVILAGYGVASHRRVLGNLCNGPQYWLANLNSQLDFRSALYMSHDTGQTGVGEQIGTSAVFPTILSMLGMPIPAQQVTKARAIKAAMKT